LVYGTVHEGDELQAEKPEGKRVKGDVQSGRQELLAGRLSGSGTPHVENT